MCSEEYSIVRSDHQRSIVAMFERFLDEDTLVDCTVAAEGRCLKAHRLMLSACSPYFELLFSREKKKDKIVVLEDLKFEDLESLIAFVYRGQVTVPKDRLRDFVSAAESLQIKGLPSNVLKSQREKTEVSVVCRKVSPAPHTTPGHVRCSVISGERVEDEHRNVSSTCWKENGNKKPCTTTLVLEESMLLQQPFVMNNEILSLDTESLIEPKEEVDVQDTPIWENEKEAAKLCNSATTSEQFPRERSQVDTDCASPLVSSTPSDRGGAAMVDSSSRVQMELIAQSCSIKNEHISEGMIEIFASDSENIEPMETVWVEEMQTSEREDEIANTDSGDIHNRETLNEDIAAPSSCTVTQNNKKGSAQLMKREEPEVGGHMEQGCKSVVLNDGMRERVVGKEQLGVVVVDKGEHVIEGQRKKREVEETSETDIDVEQSEEKKGGEEEIAPLSSNTFMVTDMISAKSPKFLRTVRRLKSCKRCDVCMAMFDYSGQLERHMRIHSGERPFECELCKRSFTQSSHLISHMRTHTVKGSFRCNVCKRYFAQSSSLATHVQTNHSFQCDVCKMSFTQRNKLTTHMQSHTGERPFQCNVCEMSFSMKCRLRRHMRRHSDEHPFQCLVCKKSYKYLISLELHKWKHESRVDAGNPERTT